MEDDEISLCDWCTASDWSVPGDAEVTEPETDREDDEGIEEVTESEPEGEEPKKVEPREEEGEVAEPEQEGEEAKKVDPQKGRR